MTLPFEVILLVLLAALCHAGWNAVIKIGGDRLVVLTVVNLVGGVLALCALPFVNFPHADAWPWLLGSVVVHLLYYYFIVQQYRYGELGQVYPIARGLSPLLVAFGASVVADETLPLHAIIGVMVASLGVLSLAFENGLPWKNDYRAVLYACGSGVIIACYTVLDGMGVRQAGGAAGYVVWLFMLDALPLTLLVMFRRGRELRQIMVLEWRKSLFGGTLAIVAYGLVIWAMSRGSMAQVSALRETSVVFAVLIGVFALKERFGPKRLLASVLVVAGLLILHL